MKRLTTFIAGLSVAAFMVVTGLQATASAAGACSVPKAPLNAWGSYFTRSGNTITATFDVVGSDCTTPVTLAVWKAPSASGNPVNAQKLFTYTTQVYGPGRHNLVATLPDDCFFQADLVEGASPTAPDGTPNYMYQNGQIIDGPLRDFTLGGSKVCEDKPVTPVTPVTPTTPSTPVTPPAPAALPNTGLNIFSVLGIATGLGVIAAITHRKLQKLFIARGVL